MAKKYLSLLLICCLLLGIMPVAVYASDGYEASFSDVKKDDWFYDAVAYAQSKGLMDGIGNRKFDPEGTATRAMVVTILHRLHGSPDPGDTTSFSDVVPGSWYEKAVKWAATQNIVNGYDGVRFGTNDPITREQLVTILYRYADYSNFDTSARADLSAYHDYSSISAYAKQSIEWASAMELIQGVSETELSPQGTATRAQIATILTRFSIIFTYDHSNDTDSDGDGLYDDLELLYGTNRHKKDTDGDKLNDFDELKIGTNPTLTDTDRNGISDYDEDADQDGISNGEELKRGTSPTSADSDADGLGDLEEVQNIKTDPTNRDTDKDGASDGWEVENGFDPLTYDSTFQVQVTPAETTEADPVTAGVETELSGSAASELEVKPVGVAENCLLSPTVAGYLGTAYEFHSEEAIDHATITFYYDKSLGKIGETFQPRIYYFNDEEGTFEELPNQIVEEGKVQATVEHFSTYVLLNKVAFDAVWETEIKPPLTDGETDEPASLAIVFVIDYSLSMENNDPNYLCKQVSKDFIAKLRDGKDSAGVVQFIRVASVLSNLTTDKEALISAIDSISYDDGYGSNSGTNGSAGLMEALNMLSGSDSKYKYIVFITDGEDNKSSYSYDTIVDTAVTDHVVIYTVGMGSSSEETLRFIANGTEGKYYKATANIATEDVLDLDKVFKEIESETIDLTTDTNKDGIPDYYNDMIFRGELVLSNGSREFMGRDFNYDRAGNLSSDFDGDGLSNGLELRVVHDGDKVYLKMYSDPMMEHSDADGVSDSAEHKRGSDPLRPDYDGNSVGSLTRTDFYYYTQIVDLYDTDAIFRSEQKLFGIGLTEGFEKIARDQLINYFYNYSSDEYLTNHEAEAAAFTTKETSCEIISGLLDTLDTILPSSDDYEDFLNSEALSEVRGIADIIADYKEIGSDMYYYANYDPDWYEQGVIEAMQDLLDAEYPKAISKVMELSSGEEILANAYLRIKDFHSKYKSVMDHRVISGVTVSDTITLASLGTDIAQEIITFSKINAATELFERNLDILMRVRDHSNYREVANAAQSVINALGQGASSYYEELARAIKKVSVKALASELAKTVLKENPVYKGTQIAMGILKVIGTDKTVKSVYAILCYSEMINAVDSLCSNILTESNTKHYFYGTTSENANNAIRFLTNAAQLRILAEQVYKDLGNTDAEHDQYAMDNISSLIKDAQTIKLPISGTLVSRYS